MNERNRHLLNLTLGTTALLFALGLLLAMTHVAAELVERPAASATEQPDQRSSDLRSPAWPKVRAAFLETHPTCAACGSKGTDKHPLQAHHVLPFSVDAAGDLDGDGIANELDPDNLLALCTDGVGHCNCHLLIGHAGNFQCYNENARRDAKRFRRMLANRTCAAKGISK